LLETVRDRLHEADWLNARVTSGEPLTVALIVQALECSNAGALREADASHTDGDDSTGSHADQTDFVGSAESENNLAAGTNREKRVIQAAINELGDYLAVGLGNIVNLFNPELIVIHGEMTMLGEPLLSRVRQSLLGRALPAAAARADIRFTGFGEHANLIGAGSLAWRETFDEPELLVP
jgi:predicted NBD/HSP70 family sugar kinase